MRGEIPALPPDHPALGLFQILAENGMADPKALPRLLDAEFLRLYRGMLTIRTTIARTTPVRMEHTYKVLRGTELLAEGSSTLACVDRAGKLQVMPDWFLKISGVI